MSITSEQVADLQPGDVVRITSSEWPDGAAVEGPLTVGEHEAVGLVLDHPHIYGAYWVRTESGEPYDREARTLTVVSRAPRPLYVNHHRAEPAPGDVAKHADGSGCAMYYRASCNWHDRQGVVLIGSRTGLRLLVDGVTGEVVP